MDTPIVFSDARLATRDLLRGLLGARPEGAGVVVSTKQLPSTDEKPSLPYVRVSVVGNYRDSTLSGRASVRVQVWHSDEGLGLRLALLCEALLLASSSDELRGFSPAAGPIPTEDPDTGGPLSFFTLTARLRPTNL